VEDRAGWAQAAYVYAVPHRTSVRVAMPLGPRPKRRWIGRRPSPPIPVDLQRLPGPDEVVRGWQAHLRRGMRLVLPDAALTAAVDANRAYALLSAAPAGAGDDPTFDALGTWRRVRELMERAGPTYTWAAGDDGHDAGTGAEFLRAVRRLLVRADGPGLALCSLYPPEWAGQPVEVHDAPTAHGRVSFAVRWHGTSPALLW
jgi:hypothetical protein